MPVEKDKLCGRMEETFSATGSYGLPLHDGQYGRGRGIAVATGMDTVLGSIAEMIEAEPERQRRFRETGGFWQKARDRHPDSLRLHVPAGAWR